MSEILSVFGPAGVILFAFIGSLGLLTGIYSVSVLRCRIKGRSAMGSGGNKIDCAHG